MLLKPVQNNEPMQLLSIGVDPKKKDRAQNHSPLQTSLLRPQGIRLSNDTPHKLRSTPKKKSVVFNQGIDV